jgi:hypothetical protein
VSQRAVERVREAVTLTIAEGGARFALDMRTRRLWRDTASLLRRFSAESAVRQPARWRERFIIRAFLGLFMGASGVLVAAVHAWLGLLKLSGRGQGGCVDFTAGTLTLRTIHLVGRRIESVDYMRVAGRTFVGSPSAWYEIHDDVLGWGNPALLLHDLGFVVEAQDLGTARWRGRQCGHVLAQFDLVEAGRAPDPLPATEAAAVDWRRFPVELWLDRRGRVRRARVSGPTNAAGMTGFLQVAFTRFGPQASVELPKPDEITDVDPRPKKQPRARRRSPAA